MRYLSLPGFKPGSEGFIIAPHQMMHISQVLEEPNLARGSAWAQVSRCHMLWASRRACSWIPHVPSLSWRTWNGSKPSPMQRSDGDGTENRKRHMDKQGHEGHKKNLDRNGWISLDLHIFLPSLAGICWDDMLAECLRFAMSPNCHRWQDQSLQASKATTLFLQRLAGRPSELGGWNHEKGWKLWRTWTWGFGLDHQTYGIWVNGQESRFHLEDSEFHGWLSNSKAPKPYQHGALCPVRHCVSSPYPEAPVVGAMQRCVWRFKHNKEISARSSLQCLHNFPS